MVEEDARALRPGHAQCKFAAIPPRTVQGTKTGALKIDIENPDIRIADDVAGRRRRKGGYRHAAGQSFQQHQTERVGAARKYEHIGGRIDFRQRLASSRADKDRVRKFSRQCTASRPLADYEFRAGQINLEKGLKIFSTANRPTVRKIGRGKLSPFP